MKKFFQKIVGTLKSKTFWVNVIGGALQIVNKLQGEIIPVETAIVIQVCLNVVVRWITGEPLEDK